MADREVIVLNEDDERLEGAQPGDRYTMPRQLVVQAGIDVPSGQLVGDLDPETAAAKLDLISISNPIDLEDVAIDAARINLGGVIIFPGSWDASLGQFPITLTIAGESQICGTAGTVDGIQFDVGDWVIARVDNPDVLDSADWLHIKTTGFVKTVGGAAPDASGNIEISSAELTDGATFLLETDIDDLAKLRSVTNSDLDESTDARPAEAHSHAFRDSRSFSYVPRGTFTGDVYLGGFYKYAAAEAALTQGGTQTFGDADNPHGAKAFAVIGSAGTDGTTVTLTVSGDSIDASGTLTLGDSEILVSAAPGALSANDYFETSKRWVGEVTYTLTTDGVNANMNFNYGLCAYEEMVEAVDLTSLDVSGMANVNDAGFSVALIHHNKTGFVHSAGAFSPGTVVADYATDYGTYGELVADEAFAWKRSGAPLASVAAGEGVMFMVTQSVNASVAHLNAEYVVNTQTENTGV